MPLFCDNCGHSNIEGAQFCEGCGGKIIAITSSGNLQPGVILGRRYEIKRLLKAGGMGSVYEALDSRFEKQSVALKEMLNQSTGTAEQQYMIDRFKEEAKILRNLRHMNLPGVIDYFIEAGRYYLVMDYIEGKDLETVLQSYGERGVPENLVIEWSKQVLDALEYLHSQSPPIVYRDLKPCNIMLRSSDNRIMLVDFGIARTVNPGSDTTKTGIGTPAFAPRELFAGKPEPRTDIYSLGATMHCLLTGIIPTTPFSFRPLHIHNTKISSELEAIVMKALEMEVENRYGSAKDMKDVLNKISPEPLAQPPAAPTVPYSAVPYSVGPSSVILTEPVLPVSRPSAASPQPTVPVVFSVKSSAPVRSIWFKMTFFILTVFLCIFGLLFYIIKDRFFGASRTHVSSTPTPVVNTPMPEETEPVPIEEPEDIPGMVFIEGGTFYMGSEDGGNNEKPVHEVSVDSFYMGRCEVTNDEFARFIRDTGYETDAEKSGKSWVWTGSKWEEVKGACREHPLGPHSDIEALSACPVVQISWNDAVSYCNWLSEEEGLEKCYGDKKDLDISKNGYRLPTEAEWEYACRGGTDTRYYWENEMDGSYCWYYNNSKGTYHETGQKIV